MKNKFNWKKIKRKIIDSLILILSIMILIAIPWAIVAFVFKIAYLLFGAVGVLFLIGFLTIVAIMWMLFAMEE